MKAVVQDRYGPPEVLRIAEVERPVPRDGQILVRIRATTVSQTDTHARGAHPFFWRFFGGLRRPRWQSLGVEFAGVVEAVGPGVSKFVVGDEVFGQPRGFGAHAEYLALPEEAPIARKPANWRSRRRLQSVTAPAKPWTRCDARAPGLAAASSSTARPVRSGRQPSSSGSTSVHT